MRKILSRAALYWSSVKLLVDEELILNLDSVEVAEAEPKENMLLEVELMIGDFLISNIIVEELLVGRHKVLLGRKLRIGGEIKASEVLFTIQLFKNNNLVLLPLDWRNERRAVHHEA
jgi:hypothetical protein